MTALEDLSKGEMLFLLRRYLADREHVQPRCYGNSSDALALYAVGLKPNPEEWRNYPLDEGDLGACELTYAMAPSHLRPTMLPVLEDFRDYVAWRAANPKHLTGLRTSNEGATA